MKNRRFIALILSILLSALLLTGCGKENKYVNVGVNMTTPGMSLYLTNVANELQKISTYVFFAESSEDSIEKISLDKQGIDLSYLPAEDMDLITKDSDLFIVFVDCFNEDGSIQGVWVANNNWIENAPNYSYKYILGLVKSIDYRASHMNMTYQEALSSIQGMRDYDFTELTEVMQYNAVYAVSNDEELKDIPFEVVDAAKLASMFSDYEKGTGEGYDLCLEAYDRCCTSSDVKEFEAMFDFSLMNRALDEYLHPAE